MHIDMREPKVVSVHSDFLFNYILLDNGTTRLISKETYKQYKKEVKKRT